MSNHLFTTFLQKITPFLQKINPITDWVWPMVPPKTQHQKDVQEERDAQRENADLTAIDNLLEQSFDATKKAHEDVLDRLCKEEDRVQTAENKLATLFALSAISASIVLYVNGLASAGVHWLILLVTGYCFIQVICILFATIGGLKKRSYSALNIADIAPTWTNTDIKHLVQIVRTATKNIHEYQQAGNKKITALDIAYTAFRNYLCGLALLFGVSIVFSPEIETVEITTQKIIHEIEHHPRILEILRGPPRPKRNIDTSSLNGPPKPKGDLDLPPATEPSSSYRNHARSVPVKPAS